MLDGIRILDLTREPGFLAGKILADLGADVIKLEPPGGDLEGRRAPLLPGAGEDPERSLSWLALNTSKRGITLNLASPRGRELFDGLAGRSDVVLETGAPGELDALGIGYQSLMKHWLDDRIREESRLMKENRATRLAKLSQELEWASRELARQAP